MKQRNVKGILNLLSGKISSVSREAATGAIELHLMLYLAPSMAKVLLSPTKPSLAEANIIYYYLIVIKLFILHV